MERLISTPLAALLKGKQMREYPKGQIVFYQGDSPPHMYVLKKGEVKMYDIDDQGNEKVLHILRPPAIFPFASYLGHQLEIMWFYTALTDVEVHIISYDELRAQMQKDSRLGSYLLERLVKETHELFVRLDSMSKTTIDDKLVAALKFLGLHHATRRRNNWYRVSFPVSHQLLADITGVTRESVTMAMKQFHERRIVRSPRPTILEINFDRLIKYNPGPSGLS
jgi:CRP/FNR family transcriptional regulator